MNQEFDQILDQAIMQIAQGESVEVVASKYPDHYQELLELLPIVSNLNSISIATAPMPMRRHKFAEPQTSWLQLGNFLTNYKFVIAPLILIVIALGGFSLNKATNNSLPGQVLYYIKSAKEQAQVTLTFDQNKLATLHVELSQKRLEEVKRAIEANDPKQELAALNELTEQTEKTLTAISQVAVNPQTDSNNQELLDNLVAINKEQKSLIQAATESSDTKEQATVALNESKETDINLAKLIATVNEQTLLDLPNKISVTGVIVNINDRKVTIEKNTFTIDDQTLIVGATGEATTNSADLKGKVTVIGTRDNNNLIAKKIVIIDPEAVTEPDPVIATPQVKGTVTTTPYPNTHVVVSQPETDDVVAVPQEAFGGFIAEPADSQYLQ